jgi:hypothetical protein
MSLRGRENVRLLNLSNWPGEDFFLWKRFLVAYEKKKQDSSTIDSHTQKCNKEE